MVYLLVRHKVRDFIHWKQVFDDDKSNRMIQGSSGGLIFRNEKVPDEVYALLIWDNFANARRFIESEDVHDKMALAGVIDNPDIVFLSQEGEPEY